VRAEHGKERSWCQRLPGGGRHGEEPEIVLGHEGAGPSAEGNAARGHPATVAGLAQTGHLDRHRARPAAPPSGPTGTACEPGEARARARIRAEVGMRDGGRRARWLVLGAVVNLACGGEEDPGAGRDDPPGAGATAAGGANSAGDGREADPAGGSSQGGDAGSTASRSGEATGATSAGGTGGGAAAAGIAERYPGDQGIESDPAVLFADDFESYRDAAELWGRWDNTYQQDQTRIVTGARDVFAGAQALSFTLPTSDEELSNAVEQVVSPEVDTLYLRFYQKIDGHDDITGSHHNGGSISAHYQGPGQRADEANHFLAAFESWRGEASEPSPGLLNAYVYHFDQRDVWGDHFFPSGLVMPDTSLPFDFGADFVARPDLTPELDRWYCYELMLAANTVGARDGRITLWLDGALIADFGNLVLRDDATVRIDRFSVMFHAGANPGAATTKYVDNVVAATAYIGPLSPP